MLQPSFADLSEVPWEGELPPIDRPDFVPTHPDQEEWMRDGVLVKRGLLPDSLIDSYCRLRERLPKPGGWSSPVPYMRYSAIKDICLFIPVTAILARLMGEEMGLHLNLTGWVSTERSWHQDDYLNPEFVMAHYIAVWMALDDVSPESGPFEYVPGSHKWPMLRRQKVLEFLGPGAEADPAWPTKAEEFVTPACEREIQERGAQTVKFLPKKGDVLFWHGRLLHQGSKPTIPGTKRKALISHYTALSKRFDMPDRRVHSNPATNSLGTYFHLDVPMAEDERL